MELFGLPTPPTSCPLRRADSASSIKQHECGWAATTVSPFIILTNFHTLFNYISLWWLHDIKLFYCFRFLAGILSAKAQNWCVVKRNRIYQQLCVGWFDTAPFAVMNSPFFFTGAQIVARKWVAFVTLWLMNYRPDRDCCTCTGYSTGRKFQTYSSSTVAWPYRTTLSADRNRLWLYCLGLYN